MVARAIGLSAVWLASIAPLVVPGAAERFADASRLALAALPWIATLGLPRARLVASRGVNDALDRAHDEPVARERSRARSTGRRPHTTAPFGTILLALPPLVLGASIDLAAGISSRRTIVLACLVGLVLALAVLAAERAARMASARRAHAIAWLVLVPGLPALVAALELGGAPAYGSAPSWLVGLADASPISWIARAVGGGYVAGRDVGSGLELVPEGSLAAVSIVLVLLAVAEIGARARSEPAASVHGGSRA